MTVIDISEDALLLLGLSRRSRAEETDAFKRREQRRLQSDRVFHAALNGTHVDAPHR